MDEFFIEQKGKSRGKEGLRKTMKS